MTSSGSGSLAPGMLEAIEAELQAGLADLVPGPYGEVGVMVRHHFGWDAGAPAGKRVRPLLTLLCAASTGGDWQNAVPAAASVELIHNFSLLHDDIEDASETRRGRPTVWRQWGIPQAVNTGDFIYIVSHLACHRLLERGVPASVVCDVQHALDQACLRLALGQHLDLAFEQRDSVEVSEYLEMIGGKTAALIAAATRVGALAAGAGSEEAEAYYRFGWNLGMAFQILDDLLGVWGEPDQTGKSAADDLRQRKKTYPVLVGLDKSPEFARLWAAGRSEAQVTALQDALRDGGAQEATRQQAEIYTRSAMAALADAAARPPAAAELEDLAQRLLQRDR